ncbi:c-type cytochrome domain-containing protein [Verrucomicrobiales bacterium BCK34]|nr:c-type cytochrome domain-containing protein [Verrucomicrobiales bacterium BCK34]
MRFTLLFLLPLLGSSLSQGVEFEKEILPFLNASCVDCHKAPYEENGRTKKPKAGLRMDAAWAILAGSEDGAVLVPGEASKSELYTRVTLPHDDDDFMPPVDKADPLTPEQVELLKKWINDGADFGDWQGNLEGKPTEVTNEGNKIPVSEIQEVYTRLSEGLTKPEESVWKPVTEAGGRVQRLARESPLLEVDFRLTADEADDEAIGSASVVASNIAILNLSKTQITDDGLSLVSEMPRLVHLNLSQTGLGDSALKNISGLNELRTLNLWGTKVTDAGLKQLKGLKNLEAIYLWQSKATNAGVKELTKALPNAKISLK